MDGIAGSLGYGHSYVRYRDTETGEARIARAGPSEPYDGGSSGAVNNTPSPNGATIQAIDTPLRESVDRPSQNPGSKVMQSVTVKTPFSDVRESVGKLNGQINDAQTPYEPQGNNSNRYAGDAFEALTGTDVKDKTPIKLPGLDDGDLPREIKPR